MQVDEADLGQDARLAGPAVPSGRPHSMSRSRWSRPRGADSAGRGGCQTAAVDSPERDRDRQHRPDARPCRESKSDREISASPTTSSRRAIMSPPMFSPMSTLCSCFVLVNRTRQQDGAGIVGRCQMYKRSRRRRGFRSSRAFVSGRLSRTPYGVRRVPQRLGATTRGLRRGRSHDRPAVRRSRGRGP